MNYHAVYMKGRQLGHSLSHSAFLEAYIRYTICVDFDGVIHSYTSPWVKPHVIPDPPVEGAIIWLHQMVQHFTVVIFSTRCRTWRGRRAMRRWLRLYSAFKWDDTPNMQSDGLIPGLDKFGFVPAVGGGLRRAASRGLCHIQFSYTKPPALIYLDDRAVRFEGPGTFPTKDAIHRQYIPWNNQAPPEGEIL